jgi:hypothetical protein
MVYIVVESIFPHDKASEAGKKWLETTKKFPPDRSVSKQIMVAIRPSSRGMISLSAWEVKEGKEKEALVRMNESMLMFAEIPGCRYSIKTFLTSFEAMGLIGLKPPED